MVEQIQEQINPLQSTASKNKSNPSSIDVSFGLNRILYDSFHPLSNLFSSFIAALGRPSRSNTAGVIIIGRNGVGKSTLLRYIAMRNVPIHQTTINLEPEKRWYITTRLEEMYNQLSSSSSNNSICAVFVDAARRGAVARGTTGAEDSGSSMRISSASLLSAAFFAGGFFGGGCAFVLPDSLRAVVIVFALDADLATALDAAGFLSKKSVTEGWVVGFVFLAGLVYCHPSFTCHPKP